MRYYKSSRLSGLCSSAEWSLRRGRDLLTGGSCRLEGFVVGSDVRDHGGNHQCHSDPQPPIAVDALFRGMLMFVVFVRMVMCHSVICIGQRTKTGLDCTSISSTSRCALSKGKPPFDLQPACRRHKDHCRNSSRNVCNSIRLPDSSTARASRCSIICRSRQWVSPLMASIDC